MLIKILTIFGLSLQFIAFWLAAPEILGPEWLKKTDRIIRKMIIYLPSVILFCLGVILGILVPSAIDNLVGLLIVAPIFIGILVFHKKLILIFDRAIATPLLNKLILKGSFRYLLLKIAAAFFTIGFCLQIVAIIRG